MFLAIPVKSQEILLSYTNEKLNAVLVDLSEKYNVQVTISSEISSNCTINIEGSYSGISTALNALAEQCSLEVNDVNGVYVFSKSPTNLPEETWFHYKGQILDQTSGEPLPNAKIQIGKYRLLSNEDGKFSIRTKNKKEPLIISYLGYYVLDTNVRNSSNLSLNLKPNIFSFQPIEVMNNVEVEIDYQNWGNLAGHMRFNDVSTSVIPGGGNNFLFNYLRLYPGILAAGESLSEYSVWGSYRGQNQIIFDGITLFSSAGQNDNIGRVNPSLIKSIDVYKAGYNVDIGDRVGGIMIIEGKHGSRDSVLAQLKLGSQVASGYLSLPVFNTAALQIAGRQSYFGITNKILPKPPNFIESDYDYSDLNIKFSGEIGERNYLEINGMYSTDSYEEFLNNNSGPSKNFNGTVSTEQLGASLKYTKDWKNGGITVIEVAESRYQNNLSTNLDFEDSPMDPSNLSVFNDWENSIDDLTGRITHYFTGKRNQETQVSLAYIGNSAAFISDSNKFNLADKLEVLNRINFFAKESFQLGKRFNGQIGLRTDLPIETMKVYIQPRLSAQYSITDQLQINAGWGIYNQFIGQLSLVDEVGNLRNTWQVLDDVNLPVLRSQHNVLGLSFSNKRVDFGLEGFYIATDGLSRIVGIKDSTEVLDKGNTRSYGGDIYLKYRFKRHEIWTSYSLSKAEELFEFFTNNDYKPALHDQRHELKFAGTFNWHPFYFSVANVWGSGFRNSFDQSKARIPYNRLDIAFEYQKSYRKLKLKTGLSIINVLNNKNIRLYQFANFPDGGSNSALGLPFTPNLYLNLAF